MASTEPAISKAASTAAASQGFDSLDGARFERVNGRGRTQRGRNPQFAFAKVDGNDLARTRSKRAKQRTQAHSTQTQHSDAGPGLHARCVHDRADTSQHGATEERGLDGIDSALDLDAGIARDDSVIGECRNAEQM